MMRARRWIAGAIATFIVGTAVDAAASDQTRASEQAVKAAYLFNFAQFVRWPGGAVASGAPFTICVLGRDPFGSALDTTLAKESIDGHRVAVRRIGAVSAAGGCQIVFISANEAARRQTHVRALASAPILTVSDGPDFLDRGGMIQFVSVDNRIRFEINLDATETAGLAPSSELARVALSVRRGSAEQ